MTEAWDTCPVSGAPLRECHGDVRQYTAGQIETAIAEAVRAHDFPAVVSLLRMLAVADPHRAGVVYGAMLGVLTDGAAIAQGRLFELESAS